MQALGSGTFNLYPPSGVTAASACMTLLDSAGVNSYLKCTAVFPFVCSLYETSACDNNGALLPLATLTVGTATSASCAADPRSGGTILSYNVAIGAAATNTAPKPRKARHNSRSGCANNLKELLEKLPGVRLSVDWDSLLPWNIQPGKN